jgi:outer membrane receptor for ferrienterochelin and colicins
VDYPGIKELSSKYAPQAPTNLKVFVDGDSRTNHLSWDKSYRGGDSVYGESIYTKRYELIAMHPFLLAKQSFRLQISFNLHDQNSAYGTQSFIAKQLTSFNQLLYDKKMGARQKVLLGATLRYTSYNDNTVANTQKNDYQKTLIPGLFAQDEIQLNASQTLLVGARLDHYFVHGFIFAPRVNYKLNFGSNQTLRVSAGNGFRVVNIFTEDHAALTGAREVVVANNIKPEESWNINVQYSSWVNRKRGFLEWDATVFYTWFGNKIIPNYDKDPNKIYAGLYLYYIPESNLKSAPMAEKQGTPSRAVASEKPTTN